MNNSKIYRFEERFSAHTRPSNARIAKSTSIPYLLDDIEINDARFRTGKVPGVEILMSEQSFLELLEVTDFLDSEEYRHFQYMNSHMGPTWLNQVLNQQSREERELNLRTKFPALREAWEQYQILLKLIG